MRKLFLLCQILFISGTTSSKDISNTILCKNNEGEITVQLEIINSILDDKSEDREKLSVIYDQPCTTVSIGGFFIDPKTGKKINIPQEKLNLSDHNPQMFSYYLKGERHEALSFGWFPTRRNDNVEDYSPYSFTSIVSKLKNLLSNNPTNDFNLRSLFLYSDKTILLEGSLPQSIRSTKNHRNAFINCKISEEPFQSFSLFPSEDILLTNEHVEIYDRREDKKTPSHIEEEYSKDHSSISN